MFKAKHILVLALTLALGGALAWMFVPRSEKRPDDAKTLVSRKTVKAKGKGVKRPVIRSVRRKVKKTSAVVAKKPGFEIGDEAEKLLNEEQRKLLEEIRAALRNDDYKTLMRLVNKLQTSEEWPDGIPKPIKMAALKALGWYGGKCLTEITGFLADLDREVVDRAVNEWDNAIAELDHDVDWPGELGIASNIRNAAKVVTNMETMDSILSEIHSSLRHSVAVETIKEIMATGNNVAKSRLPEVIENLTGKTDISTAEQLDEWLKTNPDDPDDDFMYGGKEDAVDADDD